MTEPRALTRAAWSRRAPSTRRRGARGGRAALGARGRVSPARPRPRLRCRPLVGSGRGC